MFGDGESLPALKTWHCFGCDPRHAKGLRLTFEAPGADRLLTRVTVSSDYASAWPIVHGGILATIFDELMVWCLLRHRQRIYVTAEMSQQMKRPALVDTPLLAEAIITEESEGAVLVSANLSTVSDPDVSLATASGRFVPMPQRLNSLMPSDQQNEIRELLSSFAEADAQQP